MKTDWVPTSARTVVSTGGGGGGGSIVAPAYYNTIENTGIYSQQTGPQNQSVDFSNDYRADINDSGKIDIVDFNLLLINWGKKSIVDTSKPKKDRCPVVNVADVNCDGKVDILDFNLVLVYWGTYVGDQGAKLKK